jgi:CelD/BcsL family acetyltransferase involved in cellulose biosynthesis
MKIETYTDLSGFDALAEEWNDLLKRSAFDTLFLTWEWQRTWWEHLGEGDLFLITLRDDQGHLAGIAPLYRTVSAGGERKLSIVGCLDVSDYLDIIVAQGHETEVYGALLDYLNSAEMADWDVAELCNVPEISPAHQALAEMAVEHGHEFRTLVEDVCPVIDLPATWDAYLDSLDKKQRHEIRRKMRRIQREADVHWYIVDQDRDMAEEIEAFIELHQKSSADKDDFMDEQMKGFFHAVAHVLQPPGWLQLAFIEVDGQKAASMLNFDYKDAILVYNSGYDPQHRAHLSSGIVLLAYCIQHAIELGRARFDFLRGDEAYKYRFGAKETKVYRLIIVRSDDSEGDRR